MSEQITAWVRVVASLNDADLTKEFILPGMVDFLKSIGVKTTLLSSPDDLEVKDEDILSKGPSFME